MRVKLLTDHHLEFLSLKGGRTGWLVYTCRNATLLEITCCGSYSRPVGSVSFSCVLVHAYSPSLFDPHPLAVHTTPSKLSARLGRHAGLTKGPEIQKQVSSHNIRYSCINLFSVKTVVR